MTPKPDKVYLTPTEAARLLLVSPITVRAWAQKGLLPSETTPGGHRRFRLEEVERFKRSREESRHPRPLRVLIVEDDAMMRDYLVELLDSLSPTVECEEAGDGFEAGRKVESFSPDVVLLDLMMPGMDGFEVCRRIKEDPKTSAIRVLAMTGYPSDEFSERILRAGAETCLAKPIDQDELTLLLGARTAATG